MKKLEVYLGKSGSGKSLSMLMDALKEYKEGKKIAYILTEEYGKTFIEKYERMCSNLNIEEPEDGNFLITGLWEAININFFLKSKKYDLIYIDGMRDNLYSFEEMNKFCELALEHDKTIYISKTTRDTFGEENFNLMKEFNDLVENKLFNLSYVVEKHDHVIQQYHKYNNYNEIREIDLKQIFKN